ncbi:MAG: SMC-Scp complex subunit ScpB, partial [Thermodesulfovibrionia bacterium]|nr:SMC-Scp complex subunit ScpB [Thermodesulfovibrionia bacterium]
MEDREAKSIIEALLFISADPLTSDTLTKILELDKKEIERLMGELINEYQLKNAGIFIAEIAGGVQMVTNPVCAPWIK